MRTALFFSRFVLYFIFVSTPLWLEPAVVVAYDSVNVVAWFFLAPLQMLIAYFLHPSFLKSNNFWLGPLLALLLTFLTALLFSGWESHAVLLYIYLSLAAFVLTRLIFYSRGGSFLAFIEVFFFAFAYFSFLNFTRSAPEIAQDHPLLARTILFLLLLSFLFHIVILYLAAFPDRSFHKKRNELLAFVCLILPLFVLFVLFAPQDFVKHEAVLNRWNEEPPPLPQDLKPKKESQGQFGEDQEGDQQEKHNRNGLPLGDREQKFPSELQGGDLNNEGDLSGQKPPPSSNDKNSHQEKQKKKEQQQKDNQSDKNKQRQGQAQPDANQQGGTSGGSLPPSSEPSQPNNGSGQGSSGKGKPGPKLEGVPSDQWENYRNSSKNSSGGGGQKGKQDAIMVIASRVNPVYAAEAYLGTFSQDGLSRTVLDQEPLNGIVDIHLIETWQDKIHSRDDKRRIESMFFLSTIKQRVAPYRPYRIQPTVQNKKYHPFDLSYHVQSRISTSLPEDWLLVRKPTNVHKQRMAHYLQVELPTSIQQGFQKHLGQVRRDYQQAKKKHKDFSKERYFERVDAILRGFSGHRYELGFDEAVSMKKLHNFLSKTKKGDCTEFSHTAAILGRLAEIPSRVVIGYLASKDLQTPAHRGAIYHLQQKIDFLKKYKKSELYLVTSSHHHAWVQFWMPDFGWIDFETTSYAIPPKPGMDPNNMDVVIPLIEEETLKPSFTFPWQLILKILGGLFISLLSGLYLYRYGRQMYYWIVPKLYNQEQLLISALKMRLLMRIATEGYPLKSTYKTTLEYAQQDLVVIMAETQQKIEAFAKAYTMLRFRENYQENEKKQKLEDLQLSFTQSMAAIRRRGFIAGLVRIFSLRSLYY